MTDGPLPPGCRQVVDPESHRGESIPGFAVRDDGTVLYWSGRRRIWIPLVPKVGPGGFRRARVVVDGRVRELGIALIVLRAFVGPRPLGCEPLHFPDTDPGNNRVSNLRWAPRGTSKLGRQLGPTMPPLSRGVGSPNALLVDEDVVEARDLYRAGFGYKEIADRLVVHPETARKLLIGETWSHVPDPVVMRKRGPGSEDAPLSILTWTEAREIRGHHAAGMPVKQIAALYGVSRSTVRDIIKGRTWRED